MRNHIENIRDAYDSGLERNGVAGQLVIAITIPTLGRLPTSIFAASTSLAASLIRPAHTIMGAVSQCEREEIGERTRDALRHKRGNGERVGNIEFGFRLSADLRHLEPDPTEQAALAQIRNLRRQGYTLRGIAATLNSGGHRTRRGTDWRLESVARVIKQHAARQAA